MLQVLTGDCSVEVEVEVEVKVEVELSKWSPIGRDSQCLPGLHRSPGELMPATFPCMQVLFGTIDRQARFSSSLDGEMQEAKTDLSTVRIGGGACILIG